ncbi:MAG: hypothetical protein QXQ41_06595, partial [Candidatus Bathyarchaeia archaeon]
MSTLTFINCKHQGRSNRTSAATALALTILAILLMLNMSTVGMKSVAGQELPTRRTFPYIGAIPNPVGVRQEVLLHVGITQPVGMAGQGWENLSVEIIRPDGKTDYIRGIKTDSTGGTGVVYVPDMVGTYKLRTIFPEQVFGGTRYLASTSDWLELIVTEKPAPEYPTPGLPIEYWTRPIDAQLREWSTIAGSWLTTPENLYAPYNDGPESPHILWVKPLTSGGIIGGDDIGRSFEIGDAYEGKWTGSSGGPYMWLSSSIIVAGKLYYQTSGGGFLQMRDLPVVYHCVDLHTGEELWTKTFLDNQTIDFGQLLYWDSFNMHGGFAYLVVTKGGASFFGPPTPEVWYFFDAYTGDLRFIYRNVPSGSNLYGPKGEICRYTINLQQGWITKWNSTEVVMKGLTGSSAGSWGSNAHGRTHDATRGIMWNKTIPTGLPGSVLKVFLDDRAIGGLVTNTKVTLWGISLKPGEEGKLLFLNEWTAPDYWADVTVSGFQAGFCAYSKEDKVAVLWIKETREHYGFSLETGKYLWGPTPSQHYLDALEDSIAESRIIAYGKLYVASVSGIVYCYDVKTGELLWKYEIVDPYNEILWATTWWAKPLFITDGKLYVGHYEHSPIDPRPRGAPFICLDANTGELIFRADGLFRQTRWGGRAIIGDSIIATMDTYDQRVYAIGKGPSSTTVTVAPEVTQLGESILIKGTVMDVSPGTSDAAIKLRFPSGVPAVADECMGDWMLYVYKQFPISLSAGIKGVWVSFEAIDPDGKYVSIGGTTTDGYTGTFSIPWKPDKAGLWTLIMTFPGSKSYYPSSAVTTVLVEPAPEAPPTPATPEQVESASEATKAAIAAV